MGNEKLPISWKWAVVEQNLVKFGTRGYLVTSMWVTFSLVVFKVIWGSFGALGHWSHECLMSLRGFPKDSVVHENSPQRAVVAYGRHGY